MELLGEKEEDLGEVLRRKSSSMVVFLMKVRMLTAGGRYFRG
jgi:hypothetical protein